MKHLLALILLALPSLAGADVSSITVVPPPAVSVTVVTPGPAPVVTVTLPAANVSASAEVPGPQGPQGPPGVKGEPGEPGPVADTSGLVPKTTTVNGQPLSGNVVLASTALSDVSPTPASANGQIPIWNNGTRQWVPGDPLVQGLTAEGAALTGVNPVAVGGKDGSGNNLYLSLDSSGRPTVNVNGPVAVTGSFYQAIQPTSSAQLPAALDGSGYLKTHEQGTVAITSDGTLTTSDVKLPSGLTAPTAAPAGTEAGLITRNIPSGTQAVAGNVTATISGTPSVAVTNFPGTQVVSGTGTFAVSATQLPGALDGSGYLKTHEQGTANVAVTNTPSVTVSGTATVAGTVTANQGTANTAANAWPHKITDGTNTAAVKAASTAAGATDPALVVALSPNNSVAVAGTVTTSESKLPSGLTAPTSAPAGTEAGLIVRNIPSGTQTVSITGTPTVNVAASQTIAVTQATGTNLHTVVDSGTVSATISGTPTVTANAGTGTMTTSDNHTTAAAPISVRLSDGASFYTATGGGGNLATAAKGSTAAGNPTSEATDANIQSLHVKVTNSALPLPTGASTETTLASIKTQTDKFNFDTAPGDGDAFPAAALEVENYQMGFNGTTWDRVRAHDEASDGEAAAGVGRLDTDSHLRGFNGTSWDRIRAHDESADGESSTTPGRLDVDAHLRGYNGTTWDRLRATTANGLAVDVTRVQGTVPVSGTFWQTTQPVSQTLGSAATRWYTQISDGSNNTVVRAGSSQPAFTDAALVVADRSTGATGTTPPSSAQLMGGGSIAGASNFNAVTVKSPSTAAAATDTSVVVQPLLNGVAVSTAASGVQKVGIVGNTGATVDAVINGAASTNVVWTSHAPSTAASAATNITGVTVNTATVIKAAAGNVYGVSCANANASTCFLQFYNSSTAPTCGTGVTWAMAMPASGTLTIPPGAMALANHTTGISVCMGTTYTGATACTTANACTIFYK